MKHLLLSAAVAALTLPAHAQDSATPEAQTETPTLAQDAGQAAQDAAAAAEGAAHDAMEAAGDAADAAGDAMQEGAAAVEGAVTDMVEPATETGTDMAPAEADAAMPAATGDAVPTDTAPADDAPVDAAPAEGDQAMPVPADAAAQPVVAPDVNAPAISEANPGTLGSWVLDRRIYTTNQPAGTEWADVAVEDVPAEWEQIAKVDDIVLDDSGQLVGYIADIGGFLGIGAKQVLLGADAIHLVSFDSDAAFATNFTKEELEALPDFNKATVRE